MLIQQQPFQQQPWTPRDDVLLHTCHIANLMIMKGDLGTIPEVVAPFPTWIAGERLWSAGPCTLSKLGPAPLEDWPGNQPPPGLGVWAVTKVVNTGAAYINAATGGLLSHFADRRAWHQEQSASTPRWVPFSSGTLFTSAYGFYHYTPQVYQWDWGIITSAQLKGPGLLHLTGNNRETFFEWQLMSDWAELVFVTWALERHRKHRDIVASWLPHGWIAHARSWGRAVPVPLTLPSSP